MATFGEVLRRERELRQITLREISEATKINLRYLDALERDDFRHLPGGVFNKGFVRAFAQHIGIDPDTMVDAYLAEERAQNARSEERSAEVIRKSRVEAPAETGSPVPARRVAVAVAALLVVAGATVVGALWATGRIDPFGRLRRGATAVPAPSPVAAAAEAPPSARPEPSPAAAAGVDVAGGQGFDEGFAAKVVLVRATGGAVRCDESEATPLGTVAVGGAVDLRCREFLEVQADDGGALRVGLDGAEPGPVGPDGTPLYALRIRKPSGRTPPAGGEAR